MMENQKGFTLIEVMVAMVVLTIGILAMQAMQGRSIEQNSEAGGISSKSMLASGKIEEIMNLDYDDPLLDDTDFDGGAGFNPKKNYQDLDQNGTDDDDDVNINTTGLNEEFGLRHSQCCQDGNDAFGNPVAGCLAMADQCAVYETYAIYWNIAVNIPVENNKTITIIVINQDDLSSQITSALNQVNRSAKRAEYTYIKDRPI